MDHEVIQLLIVFFFFGKFDYAFYMQNINKQKIKYSCKNYTRKKKYFTKVNNIYHFTVLHS